MKIINFINPKTNTERSALKRCGPQWRIVRQNPKQVMIEAVSNPKKEFRWVDPDQIEEVTK